MGHVEENHCPRIHPSMLHDRRQVQIDFGRKLRAMNPANDEFKVVIDMQNMALGDQKQDASKPSDAYNPPYTRPDARIVNYTLNPEDFPKLGKDLEDDRSGNSSKPDLLTGEARPKPIIPPVKKFENQWVKGETLFQDSAPVVRPTPGQLDRFPNALHSERDFDPKERVNDPDDPRFNPGVFWHPIMRQFVCVHAPKCK